MKIVYYQSILKKKIMRKIIAIMPSSSGGVLVRVPMEQFTTLKLNCIKKYINRKIINPLPELYDSSKESGLEMVVC